MQYEQVGQQRRHIIRIQQVVQRVQQEHIIRRHDLHVERVQHDIVVHDEVQGHNVQVERQVQHQLNQ